MRRNWNLSERCARQLQLEIGVQSTNPDTIKEIHRHMDLVKLKQAVDRVYDYRNTHQHLDLIAELPMRIISLSCAPSTMSTGCVRTSFRWDS